MPAPGTVWTIGHSTRTAAESMFGRNDGGAASARGAGACGERRIVLPAASMSIRRPASSISGTVERDDVRLLELVEIRWNVHKENNNCLTQRRRVLKRETQRSGSRIDPLDYQ